MAEGGEVPTRETGVNPDINLTEETSMDFILQKLESVAKEPNSTPLTYSDENKLQPQDELSESDKLDYEKRVYEAMTSLILNPETADFASYYIETTLELNDFLQTIKENLADIPSGQEIAQSLQQIIYKQADELLLNAYELLNKGESKLTFLDETIEIKTLDELYPLLDELIETLAIMNFEDNDQLFYECRVFTLLGGVRIVPFVEYAQFESNQESKNFDDDRKDFTLIELPDIYLQEDFEESDEKEQFEPQYKPKILLTEFKNGFEFIKKLKKSGILPKDYPASFNEIDTDEDFENAGIDTISHFGNGIYKDLERTQLPEIIIMHIPSEEDLKDRHYYSYQEIRLERDMFNLASKKIIEVKSSTLVELLDDLAYVGGGAYYGGHSYRRTPVSEWVLCSRPVDNDWTRTSSRREQFCQRHGMMPRDRGWYLLPAEDHEFVFPSGWEKQAISPKEFLAFLDTRPCTCQE